uniref:Apple domain-containing protein n=1 Tax=Timema monikensis TaxID=170555 RepID=A0A7R9HPS2_9NEOP|nr:unnamed protein product [Timema monikensis]
MDLVIECFLRVRSGQRLDQAVVKDSLNVPSVVDCELECLRSRFFTCRIFSYRYGPAVIGGPLDNCQLSDWPFVELDSRRDLVEDVGYELYERGSYGHGCEVDRRPPRPPSYIPPVNNDRVPPPPQGPNKPTDELCYVGYGGPARLLPSSIRSSMRVPTEQDCKTECSRARDKFLFYCTAISFRSDSVRHHDGGPNCLLSDIDQRDLRPGLDYVHQEDHWMFAWNSLDPRCDPHSNPQTIGHYQDHFQDHLIPGPGGPEVWQRFTVSGRPCRYGTFCAENREAGFWSCELEGGDAGSFDYCCRPGHQCGYSEGFNYPWCYVGSAARDQWRPCSDRYFPYRGHPHGGPQSFPPRIPEGPNGPHHGPNGPYQGHNHPNGPYQGPNGPHEGPNGPQGPHGDPYGPPRYWPVAYLHAEGPPNSTVISPGDKQPALLLTKYDSQEGFDNYIDVNRYNYGKKMILFSPSKKNNTDIMNGSRFNSTQTHDLVRMDMKTGGSKTNQDSNKDKVLFEIVDEKDDLSSSEIINGGGDESVDLSLKASDNRRATINKLQPRLVRNDADKNKRPEVMERSVPKVWSWRDNDSDDQLPGPVEFRRKTIPRMAFVTATREVPMSITKVNK